MTAASFSSLAFTKPPSVQWLLPNLEKMNILDASEDAMQMHASLFMGPSVVDLEVSLLSATVEDAGQFLKELAQRCPGIKRFALRYERAVTLVEEALVTCIKGLEELEEITLPWAFMTKDVMKALEGCREIRKINMWSDTHSEVDNRNFEAKKGAFAKLEKMALFVPMNTALMLLNTDRWADMLKEVEVTTQIETDMSVVPKFFKAIGTSRHNITSLRFDLYDGTSGPFTMSKMRPLLDCEQIQRFFFRHRLPFTSDVEDLQEILESWPNLVELSLCADPKIWDNVESGLPLTSLGLFALHCPDIEEIGLYFANSAPGVHAESHRLEKIKTLHVGSSGCADALSTAMYLVEMCGHGMEIDYGVHKISPYTKSAETHSEWDEAKKYFARLGGMAERTKYRAVGSRRSKPVSYGGLKVL